MAIKPELLQQDVTAADTDIVMKTDTAGVTKTITAGNFFTWLWNKIKGSTKSALDTADPTAPVNTNAVNGALTNLTSILRIAINSDTELENWFKDNPYRQALLYLHYDSTILGLSAGEFLIYGSRDAGIVKGEYTETYGRSVKYFIELQMNPFALRTKEQIAVLSNLSSLFILDIKANTWTNHDLFYMLQNIIIPGTGVDNYTVNIMATVNGIPCNRLHVANGIQEFWTPETQVIKQYSYNDMSVCTDNIKIVACRL